MVASSSRARLETAVLDTATGVTRARAATRCSTTDNFLLGLKARVSGSNINCVSKKLYRLVGVACGDVTACEGGSAWLSECVTTFGCKTMEGGNRSDVSLLARGGEVFSLRS